MLTMRLIKMMHSFRRTRFFCSQNNSKKKIWVFLLFLFCFLRVVDSNCEGNGTQENPKSWIPPDASESRLGPAAWALRLSGDSRQMRLQAAVVARPRGNLRIVQKIARCSRHKETNKPEKTLLSPTSTGAEGRSSTKGPWLSLHHGNNYSFSLC